MYIFKRLYTHLHTIIYVNTYIGIIAKNKYTIFVLPSCKNSFRSYIYVHLYMFTDFYAVLMSTLLFSPHLGKNTDIYKREKYLTALY